jgi:hypothetical protein
MAAALQSLAFMRLCTHAAYDGARCQVEEGATV